MKPIYAVACAISVVAGVTSARAQEQTLQSAGAANVSGIGSTGVGSTHTLFTFRELNLHVRSPVAPPYNAMANFSLVERAFESAD